MPGRTDSRRRLLLVLGIVVLVAGAAVVRTAQWQVLEHGRLVALARAQTTVRVEERMQRGTIYDRTGTVVLATTVDRDRLVGSPTQLRPAERVAVVEAQGLDIKALVESGGLSYINGANTVSYVGMVMVCPRG